VIDVIHDFVIIGVTMQKAVKFISEAVPGGVVIIGMSALDAYVP
jgi:hypothetical protein